MTFRNDIVAYDASGEAVLVVEVKNKRGTDAEWAAQTRRNQFVHGQIVQAPYFLLALPDQFYLWVEKSAPEAIPPDYSIDPQPFLSPYWGNGEIPEYLTSIGFEMIVEAWLTSLTWADELSEAAKADSWLVESGLFDALKRGHLAFEVSV